MTDYFRPILRSDPARFDGELVLACGWTRFDRVEHLRRGHAPEIISVADLPPAVRDRLTHPRPSIMKLDWSRPRLMGILNVTPDSFSDGGRFLRHRDAVAHARRMAESGAEIIDVGGESTRPGAWVVDPAEEFSRVGPVIAELAGSVALSVDTRNAGVARQALAAGAGLVNDVSAMTHDPKMAPVVAQTGAALCLMHSAGDPATMQADPRYGDVLLDVYDALEARVTAAEAAGIARGRIMVDPGIGFGKTVEHNLALARRIALFHALGCVVLLGVSRKRFIGAISGTEKADQRVPGSMAVGLAAISQGVQVLRVHDVAETRQALALHMALMPGENDCSDWAGAER
jgi:dihydropteroate synthase